MPSMEYKAELDRAWKLHVAKNAGYAGATNPDPWANFRMSEEFGVSAFDGCLVRLSDKYIRVTNLMKSADNEQVGESLVDTLRDLAAYALIAVCLHHEKQEREVPESDSRNINEWLTDLINSWQAEAESEPEEPGEPRLTLLHFGPRCCHGIAMHMRCEQCEEEFLMSTMGTD